MRIIIVALINCTFLTAVLSQQDGITLSLHDVPAKLVFQQIESQYDCYFIYQENVNEKVANITIDVENASLLKVLDILEHYGLVAELVGNQVIINFNPQKNKHTSKNVHVLYGKITSMDGNPLEGVSVSVEGYNIGTMSDSSGIYELVLPDISVLVRFSYVGMQTKKIFVTEQQELNVSLKESIVYIGEVVAIGYGTVKKVENTGAISSVRGKVFEEFPVETLEEGLRGHLSGVQIVQSNGQPGAGFSVRVRGVSSLAGSNEPLYVIDGFPTLNIDVRELNGLLGINPVEIKSVDVLKDAMATSIYGSRASNGVILITTKDGIPGKMRVTHNSYVSVSRVRKKLSLLSGKDYVDYATRFYSNATSISDDQILQNLSALEENGNAETDWQNEIFQTAVQQGHSLTFSNGGEKSNFFTSINYTDNNGIVKNTDFNQFGLRLNAKHKFADWLVLEGRSSFSKISQNRFLSGDGTNTHNNEKSGIGETLLAPSTLSIYDEDDEYTSVSGAYPFSYEDLENPVAMLEALDRYTMYYYLGGFNAKIFFGPNIFNTLTGGLEYNNRIRDYYLPGMLTTLGAQTAELETLKRIGYLFEDYLTFRKILFYKLSIEGVIGFSAQTEDCNSYYISGTGFPSDDLQNTAIQAASSVTTPETEETHTAIASFFSRWHLGYVNKYFLSLSLRYDGASVFSESNKWAAFPAMAFAWRASEEDFLLDSRISDLKLRASWGLTGNQALQPYQSLYMGGIVLTSQGSGNSTNVGLSPNLANDDLTWETTEVINLGLDLGLMKNRVNLGLDYYIQNTRDLLTYVSLPGSSGYTSYLDNIGTVRNTGVELSLGSTVVSTSDWTLAVDLNFARNTNVVRATKNNKDITPSRTDDATRTTTIVRVGEPLFSFYMPKYLGLDESGKPEYEDLNNDGTIDESDNQVAGSSLPKYVYGFNTSLKYRNFTLSTNWYGVFDVKIHNVTMKMLTEPEPTGNRVADVEAYYPSLTDDYEVYDSDRFIEDASFLRLKNIKLAYTTNPRTKYINNIVVYMSAQNFLTFTKYSGYDPEVNSFTDDNQFQGIDYAGFPQSKTLTLGIKIMY